MKNGKFIAVMLPEDIPYDKFRDEVTGIMTSNLKKWKAYGVGLHYDGLIQDNPRDFDNEDLKHDVIRHNMVRVGELVDDILDQIEILVTDIAWITTKRTIEKTLTDPSSGKYWLVGLECETEE